MDASTAEKVGREFRESLGVDSRHFIGFSGPEIKPILILRLLSNKNLFTFYIFIDGFILGS